MVPIIPLFKVKAISVSVLIVLAMATLSFGLIELSKK